jgi:hypothetical protein
LAILQDYPASKNGIWLTSSIAEIVKPSLGTRGHRWFSIHDSPVPLDERQSVIQNTTIGSIIAAGNACYDRGGD